MTHAVLRHVIQRQTRAQPQSDTLEDFAATVREVAARRMMQNSNALELWRAFLRDRLTPGQVMGAVLAQERSHLFSEAARGGAATQLLAERWATTRNPGMRFLQQEQIHGRMRACTRCHVGNLAWQLQPSGSREWLTPNEQLATYAPSATAPQVGAPPAAADGSVAAVRPLLEQLGPRGYRVLPADVTNRPLAPAQLATRG